jgi:HK97 gp10 family phage protein
MADSVQFSITGVEELLGRLDSISDDLKKRGGRAALRRAGNVIVDRAKSNARRVDDPHTGRSIADNIALRWNVRRVTLLSELAFCMVLF